MHNVGKTTTAVNLNLLTSGGLNAHLHQTEQTAFEYGTHAYIAGLIDAFHIMAVLFPEKWDTERIREALLLKNK